MAKFDLATHHIMAIMNRICIAYFLNILENEGIDLNRFKPIFSETARFKDATFLCPGDRNENIKEVIDFRCSFEGSMETLKNTHADNYLSDEAKKELEKLAKDFAKIINEHEYIDIVFPLLPHDIVMTTDVCRECDSDFGARLIYGASFGMNCSMFVFDFYAVICERYREIDPHPVYGQVWQQVSRMTPEMREKFNKDSEPVNESD
jgi:hypothetical protein